MPSNQHSETWDSRRGKEMKPINCAFCGYFEKVDSDDQCFCMKSYRIIEDPKSGRHEECPLDKRPAEDADKKGFYLVKE